MKLNHNQMPVEVEGQTGGPQEFKIKASALAFKILSEGLYSNKIRAIVRELGTNAYDSHVMAGKADVPFHVHLPTELEPWFTIIDQGVGMTDAQVHENYCTYFGSSKTDTNDQVGCLGLGSKSPFAYTETFTVISTHREPWIQSLLWSLRSPGSRLTVTSRIRVKAKKPKVLRLVNIKRTYTALISPEGFPMVMAIPFEVWRSGEEPRYAQITNDPQGVTVTFPVNAMDRSKFRAEAEDVYSDFPVTPTSQWDLSTHRPRYSVRKSTWGLREERHFGSIRNTCNVRVVQGCVAYPLNPSQVGFQHPLLNSSIDLFVPIGSVEVTPSRESLSYTTYTQNNLQTFLEQVADEIAEGYIETLEKCKTRLEALITFDRLKSTNTSLMQRVERKVFEHQYANFKLMGDALKLDCVKFPNLELRRFSGKNHWSHTEASYSSVEIALNQTPVKEVNTTLHFSRDPLVYWFPGGKNISMVRKALEHKHGQDLVYLVHPRSETESVPYTKRDGEVGHKSVTTWYSYKQEEIDYLEVEFERPLLSVDSVLEEYKEYRKANRSVNTGPKTRIRLMYTDSRNDRMETTSRQETERALKEWDEEEEEGTLDRKRFWVKTNNGSPIHTCKDGRELGGRSHLYRMYSAMIVHNVISHEDCIFGFPEGSKELAELQASQDPSWIDLYEYLETALDNPTPEQKKHIMGIAYLPASSDVSRLQAVALGEDMEDLQELLNACTGVWEWRKEALSPNRFGHSELQNKIHHMEFLWSTVLKRDAPELPDGEREAVKLLQDEYMATVSKLGWHEDQKFLARLISSKRTMSKRMAEMELELQELREQVSLQLA